MANLNSTDVLVRLQRLGCCIGTKGSDTANDFFVGNGCADKNLKQLTVLCAMFEILKCFEPYEEDEDPACLTDEQAQDMFEYMAKACGICFPAVGATYISYADSLPVSRMLRESSMSSAPVYIVQEDGTYIILEN